MAERATRRADASVEIELHGTGARMGDAMAPSVEGSHTVSVSSDDYPDYIAAYIEEARQLPYVKRIYADESRELNFYTIYDANLFEIGLEMMEARGRAMDRFPHVLADFHFIPLSTVGSDAPTRAARQVFPTP